MTLDYMVPGGIRSVDVPSQLYPEYRLNDCHSNAHSNRTCGLVSDCDDQDICHSHSDTSPRLCRKRLGAGAVRIDAQSLPNLDPPRTGLVLRNVGAVGSDSRCTASGSNANSSSPYRSSTGQAGCIDHPRYTNGRAGRVAKEARGDVPTNEARGPAAGGETGYRWETFGCNEPPGINTAHLLLLGRVQI